jgi:hypothetical protein
MKSKIEVYFDKDTFQLKMDALDDSLIMYNEVINCIQAITGSKEFKTLEEINDHIKTQSGFANIALSAGLMEVSDEYDFIVKNIALLKMDILNITLFDASIKPEVIEAAREAATQYLKPELEDEFTQMIKVCSELNKLRLPNAAKYLNRSSEGEYSINMLGLQNSDRF